MDAASSLEDKEEDDDDFVARLPTLPELRDVVMEDLRDMEPMLRAAAADV